MMILRYVHCAGSSRCGEKMRISGDLKDFLKGSRICRRLTWALLQICTRVLLFRCVNDDIIYRATFGSGLRSCIGCVHITYGTYFSFDTNINDFTLGGGLRRSPAHRLLGFYADQHFPSQYDRNASHPHRINREPRVLASSW
jgi:hypothetical protein